MASTGEKDYVLGTHDEELARLGLQHRVWRPRALDAWRRADVASGRTVMDLGCGPGYATIDLAEIVGKSGRVVAVDRSRRFLDALERSRRERGLENIETHELDLDDGRLPPGPVDAVWARWVFAFLRRPRRLLEEAAAKVRRGGVFISHEYFEYATWRLIPHSAELEEFRRIVVESWRADGGEPDIGRDLAVWLPELGFRLRELRPIVDVVPRSNFVWEWPWAFVDVGLSRLVAIGRLSADRAREIAEVLRAREADPGTLLVTPGVLEIIAVKE